MSIARALPGGLLQTCRQSLQSPAGRFISSVVQPEQPQRSIPEGILLNPHTSTIPPSAWHELYHPIEALPADSGSGRASDTTASGEHSEVTRPRTQLWSLTQRLRTYARSTPSSAAAKQRRETYINSLIRDVLDMPEWERSGRQRAVKVREGQHRGIRTERYAKMARFFLDVPTTENLDRALQLFRACQKEGCTISPGSLLLYLTHSLEALKRKPFPVSISHEDVPATASTTPPKPSEGTQTANRPHATPLDIVATVLPLLPAEPHVPLLTLILTTIITHANPPTIEIKGMIMACMAARGPGMGELEEWDWALWDVYLSSHLARGNYEEGWTELMRFKDVVLREKNARIARAAGADTPQENGVAGRGPASIWTHDEMEQIARPFVSLLHHWTMRPLDRRNAISTATEAGGSAIDEHAHATRSIIGHRQQASSFPSSLSALLIRLLADDTPLADAGEMDPIEQGLGTHTIRSEEIDQGRLLPLEFLNTLMDAQRLCGDTASVAQLWTLISGMDLDGSPVDIPIDKARGKLRPDAYTYTALFRLLKKVSRPVTRRLLAAFLACPENVTPASMNAAISSLMAVPAGHVRKDSAIKRATAESLLVTAEPSLAPPAPVSERFLSAIDLPALLVLLQQYDLSASTPSTASTPRALRPDARTIDMVAAGLVKLRRSGFANVLDQCTPSSGSLGAGRGRHASNSWRYAPPRSGGLGRVAAGGDQNISLEEWNIVSRAVDSCLIELREEKMRNDEASVRLNPTHVRKKRHGCEAASDNIAQVKSARDGEVLLPISQPLARLNVGPGTGHSSDRALLGPTEILPALKRLAERAIVSVERRRRATSGEGDAMGDMTDGQVLGDALRAARREMITR